MIREPDGKGLARGRRRDRAPALLGHGASLRCGRDDGESEPPTGPRAAGPDIGSGDIEAEAPGSRVAPSGRPG